MVLLPFAERPDMSIGASRLQGEWKSRFVLLFTFPLTWSLQDSSIDVLHSRIPFLRTGLISSVSPASPALAIIALDCELVYTTSGMSLARLTVIDSDSKVVLDEHVKPQGTVIDLNTRFSGVKQEDVDGATLDAKGVRDKLGAMIDEDTVIVGHGLENDLKASLRISTLWTTSLTLFSRAGSTHRAPQSHRHGHREFFGPSLCPALISRAQIFPHPNGGTWRHALRNLTREHLGRFIQDGHSGHSAVEDSDAALELVRFKMKQMAGK